MQRSGDALLKALAFPLPKPAALAASISRLLTAHLSALTASKDWQFWGWAGCAKRGQGWQGAAPPTKGWCSSIFFRELPYF